MTRVTVAPGTVAPGTVAPAGDPAADAGHLRSLLHAARLTPWTLTVPRDRAGGAARGSKRPGGAAPVGGDAIVQLDRACGPRRVRLAVILRALPAHERAALADVLADALADVHAESLATGAASGVSAALEFSVRHRAGARAGDVSWFRTSVTRGPPAAPGAVLLAGLLEDVSQRRALEARITEQAACDPLTGLANRTAFARRVAHALAAPPAERASAERAADERVPAVLLVDLAGFTAVNDALGHGGGDAVLLQTTARLLDATRGSDTLARLGSDEFGILLGAVRTREEATLVADRALAALRAPFTVLGREIHIGASLGIAMAARGEGVEALLRSAELALHRAKALGSGAPVLFEPGMYHAALERLDLEAELREAVEREQLVVHYQPVVDLATGRATGAEALVRWPHPTRGLVSPATFVPLAERTGLIVALGRWVLRDACRTAAAWPAAASPDAPAGQPLAIAVNVSGHQLARPGFVQDVAEALAASGLAPARLILEVTESVLLEDLERALLRLEALRALGVRLALDDFGTGYSSLAYLQRLPVDVLKIDRSFTADVLTDGKRAKLVAGVIHLATALELRIVAEGIETAAQWQALAGMGATAGQGYHFARPLPAEGFRDWLAAPPPRLPHLPTPAAPARAARADDPAGPPTPGRPVVLVVDDDAQVRSLLQRAMAGAGYAVLQATDGAAALRCLGAHAHEIVLVISDIDMPELDGVALADALAARVPATPVLLVSGAGPHAALDRVTSRARIAFLAKPFTPAALLREVRALLAAGA